MRTVKKVLKELSWKKSALSRLESIQSCNNEDSIVSRIDKHINEIELWAYI